MDRTQKAVLAVCLGAGFTTLLDQSVLNVVVPALRGSLNAGSGSLQWIVAGYSLTFGLALVPAGRIGDMIGRRRLFVTGLAIFAAGGVLAACAHRGWLVAVARLVQGVGAGTVNPQILGLSQDLFKGRDRVRALGAYAAVGGLAASIGPPVGGLILHLAGPDLGWRLVLVANLPFALVIVPLAVRLLPAGRPSGHRTDLDLPGLLLLGAATVCVILPLVGTAGGWWWPVLAVAVTVVFVWWERRYVAHRRTPLLLPSLTRNAGYLLGALVAACYFGATLALNLVLSLFVQDGLGYPPLAAAALALPGAVGFAVASAASTAVVSRYGRLGVSVALGVATLSIAAEATAVRFLPIGAVVTALAVCQFVTGAAGGLINAPNQALTLAHAPPGANGLSAAILQLSQRLSASVSIAAVTAVFLGQAGANSTEAYRGALLRGALVCLALVLLALLFAVLDGARQRRSRTAGGQPPRPGDATPVPPATRTTAIPAELVGVPCRSEVAQQ